MSANRPSPAAVELSMWVDGGPCSARGGATLPTVNPTTGEAWTTIPEAGPEDVGRAVASAQRAFESGAWRSMSPTKRGHSLRRLGDLIGECAEQLAETETRENGKLYREMLGQMNYTPEWLYYFGGLADKIEGTTIPVERSSMFVYSLKEPLGVVAVISPWNSPIMITMLAVAPALAAGNTVVIKPSEYASAGPLKVAELATEAGVPDGVINVVTGGPDTGRGLVVDPRVRLIAFTGGNAGGREIGAAASGRLARVVLELGGKSPQLVFGDADLDAAEAGVLAGIYAATGQTCIAGSRLLIQRDLRDEFLERMVARSVNLVLGDPMAVETQMGPVATEAQLTKIASLVDGAVDDGAIVHHGGARATVTGLDGGLFFEPTILSDVAADSPVITEEVFGPVLAVSTFEDDDDALTMANDTDFGLAAGIWTKDVKRAHRFARDLQAGTVWINSYRTFAPQAAIGGYKQSGIGRASGIDSINQYLQTKTVWTELGDDIQDPFTIRT